MGEAASAVMAFTGDQTAIMIVPAIQLEPPDVIQLMDVSANLAGWVPPAALTSMNATIMTMFVLLSRRARTPLGPIFVSALVASRRTVTIIAQTLTSVIKAHVITRAVTRLAATTAPVTVDSL